MDEWVFVDTCIWASFFSKTTSREKHAVDELLDTDRVALVGPVVAEILLGFRHRDQADWVASRLRLAHYVEADWEDWRAAAHLGRELAGKGKKLPVTDLLLAVISRRCDAWLYSTDPHFDAISPLKRYQPPSPE